MKVKPVRPTPLITRMLTVMLTMSDTKLMQFVVEALNHFGCSVLLKILLIQVTIHKIYFHLILVLKVI